MNTDVKDVVITKDKLDGLLCVAVDLYLLKSSESPNTMVNMNNIITGVKISQLSDRHAVAPCEESLYPEFMIAIKYLVISIYRDLQVCLLYTSPSPRDGLLSRMPSSA